jgi:drug/metabolite transporter superfamily protein YnfA
VTARSIALFVAAAIAEIGGACLIWIGLREHRGALFAALGALTLALYGIVATFQPSPRVRARARRLRRCLHRRLAAVGVQPR